MDLGGGPPVIRLLDPPSARCGSGGELLTFSIDRILAPDFGPKANHRQTGDQRGLGGKIVEAQSDDLYRFPGTQTLCKIDTSFDALYLHSHHTLDSNSSICYYLNSSLPTCVLCSKEEIAVSPLEKSIISPVVSTTEVWEGQKITSPELCNSPKLYQNEVYISRFNEKHVDLKAFNSNCNLNYDFFDNVNSKQNSKGWKPRLLKKESRRQAISISDESEISNLEDNKVVKTIAVSSDGTIVPINSFSPIDDSPIKFKSLQSFSEEKSARHSADKFISQELQQVEKCLKDPNKSEVLDVKPFENTTNQHRNFNSSEENCSSPSLGNDKPSLMKLQLKLRNNFAKNNGIVSQTATQPNSEGDRCSAETSRWCSTNSTAKNSLEQENDLRKEDAKINETVDLLSQGTKTGCFHDINSKDTDNNYSPEEQQLPQSKNIDSGTDFSKNLQLGESSAISEKGKLTGDSAWPVWVYCSRYSARPSSGPRSQRQSKRDRSSDEKRCRTAFSGSQLSRLRQEFQENPYLSEKRRVSLAQDLNLTESQVKIWFQNKRAKLKRASAHKNPLAIMLMAQGLYNHSTHKTKDT